MNHIPAVQVVNPQTNMYKDLPNEIVDESFAILFLYMGTEVRVLAVLHHDVDFGVFDEWVEVTDYEMWV